MHLSQEEQDRKKVWDLIKNQHSALLITIKQDGGLDSRPMGCLQHEFDGTLWFVTFRASHKIQEISADNQVLISYAKPLEHEYVSISGRAQLLEDKEKLRDLWSEALRVWFPKGLDDPDIIIISVAAEEARYWTKGASLMAYAWTYVMTRWTGRHPSPDDVGETKAVRF